MSLKTIVDCRYQWWLFSFPVFHKHGSRHLFAFSPNFSWYQQFPEVVTVARLCDDRRDVDPVRNQECDLSHLPCTLLIALISNFMSCINSSFRAVIALSCETTAILPFSERISCTGSAISANAFNDFSGIPAKTCWVEVDSHAVHKFKKNSSLTDVPARFVKCRRNCEGVRSPISSPSNNFRTRMLLESDNLFVSAALIDHSPVGCWLYLLCPSRILALNERPHNRTLFGDTSDARDHKLSL